MLALMPAELLSPDPDEAQAAFDIALWTGILDVRLSTTKGYTHFITRLMLPPKSRNQPAITCISRRLSVAPQPSVQRTAFSAQW